MLVEIPDPEVILGVILAFMLGLGGLYLFFKVRPFIKSNSDIADPTQTERLEYYEKQLIDMKIRLDALEIQGIGEESIDPNLELKQFMQKLVENSEESTKEVEVIKEPKIIVEKLVSMPKIPNIEHVSPINYVLHLITNKSMTSRDIQITTKRSREHTSRLMKKLFESGLVQRNTETKPYTYSITEKGKSKVEDVISNSTVV
ncbi:MAG: winged helix DNA-binding protein [Nitrosopumilus sp.]|jgi:predicted transcriptional regulator|nr:winged helix DNA-binding protein [Nitrosopumilus sp.]MBT6194972.1 winged helix DNA-binding protein [Nitrosopumilus sp.]MBT6398027.1 winged helix DNA-binding protein [Nitrosopumilus sp.]MBT7781129.1 winged helix DNA-binding protein [Nitrosopumilus sp.]